MITATAACTRILRDRGPSRDTSSVRPHRRLEGATLVFWLVLIGVIDGTAAADDAPLHIQDRAYMIYGIEQDLGLIALGELAGEKSTNPEVSKLASSTVDYHRVSAERLTASAERLGLSAPTELNPVSRRAEAFLRQLDGPDFDYAYLRSVIIGSYNGTFAARREMSHGFDAELRAEAERQAGDLQTNRRAAQRLARELREPQTSGDRVTFEDRDFLLYAMHIDLAQIGFAEPAAERATDPRVRELAGDVVSYHENSYEELENLANEKGIEPLAEISGISRGTQDRIAALDSTQKLDWAFLNAHAFTSYGAHYRYEREAIHGGDADIKALAERAAGESRRQHWRALDIMNDWTWNASDDS